MGLVAVAGVLVLAGAANQAYAQRPFYTPRQVYQAAVLNQAYALGAYYNNAAVVNQAYGYSLLAQDPYYGGYYTNPYYGYLAGGANVIDAQGQFMVNQQKAYLTREQVRAARLANERWLFDLNLYERENKLSTERIREEERTLRADRARTNPPVTEINSGKSLNDLLVDVQIQQARGFKGGVTALGADVIGRLNFTTPRGGNIALLRHEGRVTWPSALSGADYQIERQRLNDLAREAVKQAQDQGKVDGGLVRQMGNDVAQLQQRLREHVADVAMDQYTEAKRFLQQFEDAVTALQQPDVANHFNGKYAFQGKTAAELVRFVTDRGLIFAPAVAGDEAAYAAAQLALAAYDSTFHGTALEARVDLRK
jgi:hypothetical protein